MLLVTASGLVARVSSVVQPARRVFANAACPILQLVASDTGCAFNSVRRGCAPCTTEAGGLATGGRDLPLAVCILQPQLLCGAVAGSGLHERKFVPRLGSPGGRVWVCWTSFEGPSGLSRRTPLSRRVVHLLHQELCCHSLRGCLTAPLQETILPCSSLLILPRAAGGILHLFVCIGCSRKAMQAADNCGGTCKKQGRCHC
mmetsp:Transcript_4616/g.7383  ORF Transcript_4616/g.7383 Transcript_4616/m.7383 type:complete len:201 (-) Transcript_4616:70-672(-)